MELRPATPEDLEWANGVYDQIGFARSGPDDLLMVAVNGTSVVGVGRVVPIGKDFGELGGMYVSPESRGQGVATSLVKELVGASAQGTLFCLPYVHLVPLYEAQGFRVLGADEAPPEPIRERMDWCRQAYVHAVTLLRWDR